MYQIICQGLTLIGFSTNCPLILRIRYVKQKVLCQFHDCMAPRKRGDAAGSDELKSVSTKLISRPQVRVVADPRVMIISNPILCQNKSNRRLTSTHRERFNHCSVRWNKDVLRCNQILPIIPMVENKKKLNWLKMILQTVVGSLMENVFSGWKKNKEKQFTDKANFLLFNDFPKVLKAARIDSQLWLAPHHTNYLQHIHKDLY